MLEQSVGLGYGRILLAGGAELAAGLSRLLPVDVVAAVSARQVELSRRPVSGHTRSQTPQGLWRALRALMDGTAGAEVWAVFGPNGGPVRSPGSLTRKRNSFTAWTMSPQRSAAAVAC